jgi:hypothetical protein
MKSIIASALIGAALVASVSAQDYHYVNGSVDKNGKHREGHYRTDPNGTVNDNWSTSGNRNPFTGEPGRGARQ